MYTIRILKPESEGRQIKLYIESYTDLSVALRVAELRGQESGCLAIVLSGARILARFGLGQNIIGHV